MGAGRRTLEFDAPTSPSTSAGGSSYDFVERLWAIRRVGFIIDQIDMNGQNKELTEEHGLPEPENTYGILTPYTSFLADERVNLCLREQAEGAGESLMQLSEVQGRFGVDQRDAKQGYMKAVDNLAAPHGGGHPF